jgi:hypothetical protein
MTSGARLKAAVEAMKDRAASGLPIIVACDDPGTEGDLHRFGELVIRLKRRATKAEYLADPENVYKPDLNYFWEIEGVD